MQDGYNEAVQAASCHAACPVATEVDMPLPGYGMTFVLVWPTIIIVGLV